MIWPSILLNKNQHQFFAIIQLTIGFWIDIIIALINDCQFINGSTLMHDSMEQMCKILLIICLSLFNSLEITETI